MPVLARLSTHRLRLEREFKSIQALSKEFDPRCDHFLNPIDAFKLPPTAHDPAPILVCVYESPGPNHLKNVLDYGPALIDHRYLNRNHDPGVRQPITLQAFLDFAIGACRCLELLHHGANRIHGELRQDSFHWNREKGRVRFACLGDGGRSYDGLLSSSGWAAASSQVGSKYRLVFVAPEQTGRTVDEPSFRTDIYSLGIFFYTLLTGKTPFAMAGSAIEIIQKVLNARVPDPSSVRLDVPPALCRVILKMTTKQMDARYKSITGVRRDMMEVQRLLEDGDVASLSAFKAGATDVNSCFSLPSKGSFTDQHGGHHEQHDQLCKLMEKMYRRQFRGARRTVPPTLISDTSNTSISDSILGPEATNGSDTSSVAGRESRSGSTPLFLDAKKTLPRHLNTVPGRSFVDLRNSSLDVSERESTLSGSMALQNTDVQSRLSARHNYRPSRNARTEVALLIGPQGCGKTTILRGIQSHMRRFGYYSFAKFDRARPAPFDAMLKVMASLLRQIFSERDVGSPYHESIRACARPVWTTLHGILDLPQSLLDHAAVSKKLPVSGNSENLGQPFEASTVDTVSLTPSTTQSHRDANEFLRTPVSTKSIRLINTYIDVLRAICTKPICIALDDLQRADVESTELIESIMRSKVPVLLVCTIRNDSERTQAEFLKQESVTRILVPPLSEKTVFDYVATTLAHEDDVETVIPLAACVFEASQGNPATMRIILQELHDRGCVYYDWKFSRWTYDLDKVFDVLSATSDMEGDLIMRRLDALPLVSKCILGWASVIGFTWDWKLVSKLLSGAYSVLNKTAKVDLTCRQSSFKEEDGLYGLQRLLALGIIIPSNEDTIYSFSSARMHTAACKLKLCTRQDMMNYCAASAMLSYLSECKYSVYPIARHIFLSWHIVKQRETVRYPHRDALWRAALRAAESGARKTSLDYYETAVKLLQDNPWDAKAPDVYYDETLQLYVNLSEAYFLEGKYKPALSLLDTTFEHARCSADKTRSYLLKSRILGKFGKFEAAFNTLRLCLSELGLSQINKSWDEIDLDFEKLEFRLRSLDVEEFVSRPLSQDKDIVALGTVLSESLAATYWYDAKLWANLVLSYITVLLDRGIFLQAGLGFVMLGAAAISRYKDPELGAFYGDVASAFLDRSDDPHTRGRLATLSVMFIQHAVAPLSNLVPVLDRAFESCLNSGDPVVSILNLGCMAAARFWAGQDVAELEAFCNYSPEEFPDWEKDMRGGTVLISIRQLCRALQGKTTLGDPETLFDDEHTSKRLWLQTCAQNQMNYARSKTTHEALVVPALYVYGHYEYIVKKGREMMATSALDDLWSSRAAASVRFYFALSLMAIAQEMPKPERQSFVDEAAVQKRSLEAWATFNDVNYYCWIKLINAQMANTTRDFDVFVRDVEDAIDHAQVHGFAWEEALALEMLAEFLLRRGSKRAGKTMMMEAISAFSRISVTGKSSQLAENHQWLLETAVTSRTRTTACQTDAIDLIGNDDPAMHPHGEYASRWSDIRAPVPNGKVEDIPGMGLDILDFSAILEFSKVISSELQINSLLEKMTAVILESVGGQAEFCAILIDSEDRGWVVGASGEPEQGVKTYEAAGGITLDEIDDMVAQQTLGYITRTKETVFVPNVLDHELFGSVSDTYLERHPEGRAVIGIPIIQSDHLMGVIHLEGRPNSFTRRNLVVLNLLTTQVAISLGNALLYRKVRKVSAANAAMVESQKKALAAARAAEAKALEAEQEAIRNVKLAEEAARSKSHFLANTSHELRTPLNGVIGMSELLKGTQLTKDQAGYADSIRMCADTLLTVINDILDFSKLEAGKMQLFDVPLNLKETIVEVVRALSYQNQERGLQTITDLKLTDDLVLGDPVRVHQVLLNILSNSYKFCSNGTVTIKARQLQETKSKVKIECSVADTGIGITKEQLSRLFKPFSQADSSTARSYGGSGLGLSICKAIVENVMGGQIWIESEPGVGTTVFFQLEFSKADKNSSVSADMNISAREPDPMAQWSQAADPAKEIKKYTFRDLSQIPKDKLRVCIAEDNAINRKIAISFVTKLGLKCEAYEDGKLAYEALKKRSQDGDPFHLVLMDVQMPVLDGYEATKAIRKDEDPNVSEVLVIAMTASAIRGDREKCIEAGMNDYLAKPVRQAALKALLDGYFDGSRYAQQAQLEGGFSQTSSTTAHGVMSTSTLSESEKSRGATEPSVKTQEASNEGVKISQKPSDNEKLDTKSRSPSPLSSTSPSGKQTTDELGRVSQDTTKQAQREKDAATVLLTETKSERRREHEATGAVAEDKSTIVDKTNR